MKFLAMDRGINLDRELIEAHLKEDVQRVWELYAEGTIREFYQRGDNPFAVLILECSSIDEAREKLSTIPFVRLGITTFDTIIPVGPFTGLNVLFSSGV
jgi:hypothetical protein